MNTAIDLMSSSTVQEASPRKPAVHTAKNTASSGERQDKAFSDALEQAESEADAEKETVVKPLPETMMEIVGFNPFAAMVDISSIPIVQIAGRQQNVTETETLALPVRTPGIMQAEGMENVLADVMESQQEETAFLDMLKDRLQTAGKPQVQTASQNSAPTGDMIKTSGEDLLNLLNGKIMQNVPQNPMDTSLKEANSAKAQEIPVKVIDESKLLTKMKPDVAAIQAQPMAEQSAAEQLNARNAKQNAALSVKEEFRLIEQPLRAVQQTQEQAADSGGKQSFNLGQSAVKPSELEPLGKESEAPSGQQQFSHFITNSTNLRSSGSAVQQPAASQTPEQLEKFDIPGQIVQQARLIKTNEDTQMVIKLRPEHLGDLTLKVTVENGVVSATFHSDNAQVRTMLETTLMQLKQELIDQGIKVNNVSVYAGLGQSLPDGQGQQQTGREQQSSRYKNRKIDLADFEDEVEKISAAQPNLAGKDGVDYRI